MNNTLKKVRVRVKRRSSNEVMDNLVTVVIRGHRLFTQGVIVMAAEGFELVETQDKWDANGNT